MSMIAAPTEVHLSFRVMDLKASAAFYAAFLAPNRRIARRSLDPHGASAAFELEAPDQDSERPLDAHSLCQLGLTVADKAAVDESYRRTPAQLKRRDYRQAVENYLARCATARAVAE